MYSLCTFLDDAYVDGEHEIFVVGNGVELTKHTTLTRSNQEP